MQGEFVSLRLEKKSAAATNAKVSKIEKIRYIPEDIVYADSGLSNNLIFA